MKLFFLLICTLSFAYAQNILIINSNGDIQKYMEAQTEFTKNFSYPVKQIDIAEWNEKKVKEYLYDEYPDIVYAIGAKAYQYAYKYLPEKKIFFSSIANWKRLPTDGQRYGVSNELHSGMQLTLIKTVFPRIRKVSMIYSKYTKALFDELKSSAADVGIELTGKKVDKISVYDEDFTGLLQRSDAFLLIPDPLLLSDEEAISRLFDKSKRMKKAVFAYHELFIKFGATLIISIDHPTIGRQIAKMVENSVANLDIDPIQYPAGTHMIFNKKQVLEYGMDFNRDALTFVNRVIE